MSELLIRPESEPPKMLTREDLREKRGSRVVVNLGRRAAKSALRTETPILPEGVVGSKEGIDSRVLEKYGNVTISAKDKSEILPIGISGVKEALGVTVSGLTHKSLTEINDLREPRRRGTFGVGFYAGANLPIAKTTLGEYEKQNHYVHNLELNGNYIIVDMHDPNTESALVNMLPLDMVGESPNTYDSVTQAMREGKLEKPYDGMIIMNTYAEEQTDGRVVNRYQTEAVITNMDSVSITGVEFVPPATHV